MTQDLIRRDLNFKLTGKRIWEERNMTVKTNQISLQNIKDRRPIMNEWTNR